VQAVDTSDATTGQAIDTNTIRALPLATQNFPAVLTLSTGAQSDLNAAAQLGRGNVRIQVNGQREDNNNYLIEGVSATDYNVAELTNTPLPNPDVIRNSRCRHRSTTPARVRNGGGNINAILNPDEPDSRDAYEFFPQHGSGCERIFSERERVARPVIQQKTFSGGSLGGPVGGGGKLGFFFVNYQGTRQRSGDSPGTLISTFIPYVPRRSWARRAAQTGDGFWSGPAPIQWRCRCSGFKAISLAHRQTGICTRTQQCSCRDRGPFAGAIHREQAGQVYRTINSRRLGSRIP